MVCWFDQRVREKVCSRADVSQSRRNDLIGAENAIRWGGAYGWKRADRSSQTGRVILRLLQQWLWVLGEDIQPSEVQ